MKTSDIVLFAVIIAVLAGLSCWKGQQRRSKARNYAYVAKKSILSKPEQVLFLRLQEALPQFVVLAQVSMHRVIRPKSGGTSAFNAMSQNAIDYVICRKDFSVVCVVELDDSSHDKDADYTRDTYMTSAGIETFRWNVKSMPAASDIYNAMRKFDLQ